MKRLLISILIFAAGLATFAEEGARAELEHYARNFNSILGGLHGYRDFKSELNKDTVAANPMIQEMFGEDFGPILNAQNLYCEEIHLKGIGAKTIALMQVEGSLGLPYLTIFVFDSALQKYTVLYDSFVRSSLPFIIPVETEGGTLFVERLVDFDTKREEGYRLLEFGGNEWKILDSMTAIYKYALSKRDRKWLGEERLERLARFDYSFAGIRGDHPAEVKFAAAGKTVVGRLHHTSVARLPSNFSLKVLDGEREIKAFGGLVWGFYTVKRGKKDHLVYIGSGSERGECTFATIESFYLKVIDLDTMECVHKSLVEPEIIFARRSLN